MMYEVCVWLARSQSVWNWDWPFGAKSIILKNYRSFCFWEWTLGNDCVGLGLIWWGYEWCVGLVLGSSNGSWKDFANGGLLSGFKGCKIIGLYYWKSDEVKAFIGLFCDVKDLFLGLGYRAWGNGLVVSKHQVLGLVSKGQSEMWAWQGVGDHWGKLQIGFVGCLSCCLTDLVTGWENHM